MNKNQKDTCISRKGAVMQKEIVLKTTSRKKKKFFSRKITTEELAFGDICFEHPLASDPKNKKTMQLKDIL